MKPASVTAPGVGGRRRRPQLQTIGQHVGRPQHLDARRREGCGRVAEEITQGVLVERKHRRCRLAQQDLQRRPRPGTAAQREKEVGFRAFTEAGKDRGRRLPQLAHVDEQARVGSAPQRQHDSRRIAVDRGQLQPQHEPGAGLQSAGRFREPAAQAVHRLWFTSGETQRSPDNRSSTGAHERVGDRVIGLADERLGRSDGERPGAGEGKRVGLGREGGCQLS